MDLKQTLLNEIVLDFSLSFDNKMTEFNLQSAQKLEIRRNKCGIDFPIPTIDSIRCTAFPHDASHC